MTKVLELFQRNYANRGKKAWGMGKVHGYIIGHHGSDKRFLCGNQWRAGYKPVEPEDDVIEQVTCTPCRKVLEKFYFATELVGLPSETSSVSEDWHGDALRQIAETLTEAEIKEFLLRELGALGDAAADQMLKRLVEGEGLLQSVVKSLAQRQEGMIEQLFDQMRNLNEGVELIVALLGEMGKGMIEMNHSIKNGRSSDNIRLTIGDGPTLVFRPDRQE